MRPFLIKTENAGYWNDGSMNAGSMNKGNFNSGLLNKGGSNVGSHNLGFRNIGDANFGNSNIGSYNNGSFNIGYFNRGVHCIGSFCTGTNSKGFFNKELEDGQNEEWPLFFYNLKMIKRKTINGIISPVGFSSYTEAFREIWEKSSIQDKRDCFKIPNWDNDIFNYITGINVEIEICAWEKKNK